MFNITINEGDGQQKSNGRARTGILPAWDANSMIITIGLVAIGLSIGAWCAYNRGLRLGGVVVISLVAVYTLLEVATLPIFVLSTVLALLAIVVIQDRWILYGRPLLLAAILIGAVIPVVTFLVISALFGNGTAVAEITFLGSVLPGIAAYNVYRQDPDRLPADLVVTTATFLGLIVLGALAVVAWVRPPCWTCAALGVEPAAYVTPILLSATADTVGLLGLTGVVTPQRLGTVTTVTTVVVVGLALGEGIRARWGLRPLGVISLPLVALFALRAWWVIPLYVGVLVVAYAGTQIIHHTTLLYGRALLSVTTVIALLSTVPVLVGFDLQLGLVVFFTGLLAGIGAYNLHVVVPRKRWATLVTSGGYFVVVVGIARLLITPLPAGFAGRITLGHGIGALLLVGAAAWTIYELERDLPTNQAISEASPLRAEAGDK